ncbi:carbamoyl-phosphate synthase small chain, partial [Vibrio parahaemolyticus VPTS-2010]
SKNTALNSE